jgi:mono/diheme cytochrome c family protein
MKNMRFAQPKMLILGALFGLGFAFFLAVGCSQGPPENSRAAQAKRGKVIFKEQCASCHGMGDMKPTIDSLEAPDLTQIVIRRRAESFPVAEVARIIDGRKVLEGHGTREMPVWGEVYESEGMDDMEIRGRKGELIAYLMTIQDFY